MPKIARTTVESSTLGVGVLLVLALVAMINYFGWKYYQRFDWTAEELYSLSEKSVNVVSSLDRPVEAVVFLSPADPLHRAVSELLSRYEAASLQFTVRNVDPEKNLAEAQSLVDKFSLSYLDVIVFDRGDDRRVIETADLAEYDYSGLQMGRDPEMTEFKGEQVFTGTILELLEERKPKMLFTVGHGELSLDDASARGLDRLQALLGEDNFDLEEWAPLGATEIPEGTDVIVVAGPQRGFAESEAALLSEFAAGGGRLLLLLDPILGVGGPQAGAARSTGLEELLAEYGVSLGNDIVIDPGGPIPFFGAETFFVRSYGDHPITRPLREGEIPVIVPLAQTLEVEGSAADLGLTALVESSADGWGERDLDDLEAVARGAGDAAGPVTIAVAIERELESATPAETSPSSEAVAEAVAEAPAEAEAGGQRSEAVAEDSIRLAVFGDADFATNAQLRNVGNAELIANTLNWLTERETLIAIPPKKTEQVRLSLSGSELRTIALLVFVVLPGLSVLAGIGVFSRRRR